SDWTATAELSEDLAGLTGSLAEKAQFVMKVCPHDPRADADPHPRQQAWILTKHVRRVFSSELIQVCCKCITLLPAQGIGASHGDRHPCLTGCMDRLALLLREEGQIFERETDDLRFELRRCEPGKQARNKSCPLGQGPRLEGAL